MSKLWKVRPSEIVGLDDPYVAYCLDEAIMYAGNYIEQQLDNVKQGKGKNAEKHRAAQQQIVLERILYGKQQTFRDPAMSLKKGGE